PHIFERFYRVNQTRTKVKGSFGLGLNITQQIVHSHGGQIKVTIASSEGNTKFTGAVERVWEDGFRLNSGDL
ncbi:MAG: ATP-binding protein, partial [Prochloraceae cyanobacterium]